MGLHTKSNIFAFTPFKGIRRAFSKEQWRVGQYWSPWHWDALQYGNCQISVNCEARLSKVTIAFILSSIIWHRYVMQAVEDMYFANFIYLY